MALPVILIAYEAPGDRAWWLHIQGHFRDRPRFNVFRAGRKVSVRLSTAQVFDQAGIGQIARLRDQAMRPTT